MEGYGTTMLDTSNSAEKIVSRCKGLSKQLQSGEDPILSIPAIWDSDKHAHSEACEVILTNQRLIGFYCKSFPREKLFCDSLDLADITHVTLRQKTYEPIFREIVVSEGMHKVSIRAPRQKSETLYSAIHTATSAHHDPGQQEEIFEVPATISTLPAPVYSRETIRTAFDTSSLAIVLLFVGGIVLQIIGAILWSLTQSSQVGLPLCGAGFVAVIVAILQTRQRKRY
jgi:hypothetical protein